MLCHTYLIERFDCRISLHLMKSSIKRHQTKKNAEKTLNELIDNRNIVNVIHYSCESFYDRKDGSSPRITSIAVQNLSKGQISSFSIHQFAERNGVDSENIDAHYDEYEKEMLSEFYRFVDKHLNFKWLHWNMRDVNYGFQGIEHRCQVLKGKSKKISEGNLFDLSRILVDIYGPKYSPHPRLEKLIEINNITKLL